MNQMNTRHAEQIGGFQKIVRSSPRKQQTGRDADNKKSNRDNRQQHEFKRNSSYDQH